MRIGPIVLRLRAAISGFGIGGAAELDKAVDATLKKDMMFVIPIAEDCPANNYDSGIVQMITERFAVIAAIDTDYSDAHKTGVRAYDRLHEIRSQIFKGILGWLIVGGEDLINYRGGQMWGVNNAYLWYQFDFEYSTRLRAYDGYYDVEGEADPNEGEFRELKQESQLADLNKMYANYIMWPSANLPWTDDDMPDISLLDMEQYIDFTVDPDGGAFGRGFGEGFDYYKILNRK